MNEAAFKVIFIAGFVAGSAIRYVHTRHLKKYKVAAQRKSRLDSFLIGLAGVGMMVPLAYLPTDWLDFADYSQPAWVGWGGAAAFAAALWLLWKSHADLGENWSPLVQVSKKHTLVTSGVYARIRHPMYAAHWLWAIAQAMLLPNWIAGWSMLVFFTPLYFVRVTMEERFLLDRFGDEYRSYMKRTGRSVPRFWG